MTRLFSFLIIFLSAFTNLNGQTELFFENFNGASPAFQLNTSDQSSTPSGINQWIINNSYDGGTINGECLGYPIPTPIPATPNQPGGVTGGPQSKYLHVTTSYGVTDGVTNCHYLSADGTCNPNAENVFAKMTTDFSTIGYSNITLSFWWLCAPDIAAGEVYYSTNGGTSWTLVSGLPSFTMTPSWTLASAVIPAFLNQASIRLAFRFVNPIASSGEDPAFGVDDIKVTGTATTPSTVTTGSVLAGPYCPGNTFDVPFAVTGPFNAGNTFTVELSDASGNFTAPTAIGSLNGTTNGIITATIPPGTVAGTYKVRVKSSNPVVTGTIGPISITVSAPPTATVLPTSTTAVCNGGTATLNASAGTSHQWYSSPNGSGFTPISGATSATYTSGPLNATTYYQVKVTNQCGEATSASWQVNLQAVVDIPLQYTPESRNLCNGPVTVTVQGTFNNLAWSNGATGNSITLNEEITISVTGVDPNSCPAESDAVTIIDTEPLPITISPASPVTLCGASVNLTATGGFTNYQWTGGGTGNPLAVTATGTYKVTATDANGCESSSEDATVETGEIALIEISPENPAICPGEPTVLTAASGFSNYVWSNGATGPTLTVTQSGTYSVTASPASGGCPGESLPVVVTKSNQPIANFTYDQTSGLKIVFDNTSQNGVEYTWSFAGFGTSTSTDPTFTFPDLGPYYITLYASNGCGIDSVTKLIIVSDVGFQEWLTGAGLQIFPNPSAGDFYVKMDAGTIENLKFELIDLAGRTLMPAQTGAAGAGSITLPATQLSPGLYLLKVSAKDGRTALLKLLRTAQ